MSEYKFKVYEKVNGDDHISYRLMEQHEKAHEDISEKQLKKYRSGEEEVITEKLLDKKRLNEDPATTEKLLNEAKSEFGVKHRNEATYKGDINKLEEQRLSQKKKEEKQELASETPKSLKWWNVKSSDGLKIASSENDVKTASKKKTSKSEKSYRTAVNLLYADTYIQDESDVDDYEDEEEDVSQFINKLRIVQDKKIEEGSIPELYMVLDYDMNDLEFNELAQDEQFLKNVALEKVIDVKPFLTNKVNIDDFYVSPVDHKVVLDIYGKEYFDTSKEDIEKIVPAFNFPTNEIPSSQFEEKDFKQVDVGGTPTTVGRVTFPATTKMSSDEIKMKVSEFLNRKHDLGISPEFIDDANMEKGEVSFAISKGANSKLSFPIIVAGSKKK